MHDGARAAMTGASEAGQGADTRCLTLRGLRFEIGGITLIDGIDLALGPAGVTMIMGPNGAGKSLFLRLVHGLMAPSAGQAAWGGQPVSEATRARQSMVFQSPVLLRRQVAANVDFVLASRGRSDPARRDALLDLVGLADKARQPARLLSGGEQQRLALARALATEPEVLFLDEPTASLDPASVLRIEEIVAQAAEAGTRVFFVTHDMAQARRLGGEVLFLARGRVVERAPAERFFAGPETAVARDYLAGRIVL